MTAYSLHIGLNRVDPDMYDGWDGALSGCINDANSMMQLARTQGYQARQLLDAQATSHAIIGELGALASKAVGGDVCLITYSGHGGQVDDVSGDDLDGLDETWVCYDRQVVDDELHQMWSQFAAGVHLLVLSDSCHSGTILRARYCAHCRRDMSTPTYSGETDGAVDRAIEATVVRRAMPPAVQDADKQRRRGTYDFVQRLAGSKSGANIEAGLILISGCQDNQFSADGAVNGLFTGTLLDVWNRGSFNGDHSAFHKAILARMPDDQSPNLLTVGVVDPAFMAARPFTAPSGGTGPVSGSSTRPLLDIGSQGPDVVYLQERLNIHGASLSVDGFFGRLVERAVSDFQTSHGLVADGVVGPQTWQALDAAPASGLGAQGPGTSTVPTSTQPSGTTTQPSGTTTQPSGGSVATATRPTIQRGAANEHVTYLQEGLVDVGFRIVVDGIFGPSTESAVRSFQRSRGLPADGVVGPMTWEALG